MATWQEFKSAVEAAGVKDGDEVDYIDVSGFWSAGSIEVGRDEGGDARITG